MFKIGDLVRCIRAEADCLEYLDIGGEYTVLSGIGNGQHIVIKDKIQEQHWLANRFKLVAAPVRDYIAHPMTADDYTVGMAVTCIKDQGVAAIIKIDKTYTVESIRNTGVKLVEKQGFTFRFHRFAPFMAPEPEVVEGDDVVRVGDHVRVIEAYRPAALNVGRICVVEAIHINGAGNPVYKLVGFPNPFRANRFVKHHAPRRAAQIHPAVVVPEAPRPEFKEGDVVLFNRPDTRAGYHGANDKAGDGVARKLLSVAGIGKNVQVEGLYDVHSYWVSRDCLDLYVERVPKVGDKVYFVKKPTNEYDQAHDEKIGNGVSYTVKGILPAGHQRGDEGVRLLIKELNYYLPIECLSLVNEKVAQAPAPKKEKPKPVFKGEIKEVLDKAMKDRGEGGSICSFIFRTLDGEEYMDLHPACYAGVRNNSPIQEFATSLINHKKHLDEDEMKNFLRWFEYLLTSSPWAPCYEKTTVEEAMEKGISFNTNLPHSQLISAAIVLREGHEYAARLETFCHMLDRGYHGSVAYMVAMNFKIDIEADGSVGKISTMRCGNNHHALSDEGESDEMISFFTKGFPDLKQKPCKEKSSDYSVFQCATPSADKYGGGGAKNETFFQHCSKGVKQTRVGKGFDEHVKIDIQSLYSFADTLQELF